MIKIKFRRESVCMGDDAGNGEYTIELQDSATLTELMQVILHGGNGNDWSIPYTGADSFWVIHSDIGDLARIFTDSDGNWHISDYCCDGQTPLKELGITWTFGGRDVSATGSLPELEIEMTDNKKRTSSAKREDWKTEDMPEQHETFVLNRSFSDEEMDALCHGNIPQAMEDKWFWYMEDSTLWAHRSWTGHCIYRIDFKEDNNHVVTVNRDPEQYRCTSVEDDIESLNKLLDWWTQTPYDHYKEWLAETYDALGKSGKA